MRATSANGAGAADDAAAVRDDQGAVGEPGFVAGECAAPERVPDPELVECAERRSCTAKCKLEILAKLEAGTRLGEVGELLRREGLYTSHLTYWRKQVHDGALKKLGKPRGGKPADRSAPQCAKLVGERVPARTTAFVFGRPDHRDRKGDEALASEATGGSALGMNTISAVDIRRCASLAISGSTTVIADAPAPRAEG